MSDLRQNLRDWQQGLNLLGFNGDNVNWQSIAVLLDNRPDKRRDILSNLTTDEGGWASFGMAEDSDGTSLYLSPKGMVYWLHFGGHYGLYGRLFNVQQEKLDRAGWLHISGGRVDVRVRMTPAQERWLSQNKPHPKSCNLSPEGDWKIKPYEHDALTARPVPYPDAERFDVRPVDDIDTDEGWERLMLRINQARHRDAGTE